MKNNSKNNTPTRKNNYFVVIANFDNGKADYSHIAYMTATREEAWKFIQENYTKSVPAFVKTYSELVAAGVAASAINDFKNPKIY